MRLVTLSQARAHLRTDSEDDDADLLMKIEAASEMVLDYLGDGAESWTDSAGAVYEDSNGEALNVPKRVQSATLMMVGYLYRERDAGMESQVPTQWGYGYLPQGVTALLYSLRRPTVG